MLCYTTSCNFSENCEIYRALLTAGYNVCQSGNTNVEEGAEGLENIIMRFPCVDINIINPQRQLSLIGKIYRKSASWLKSANISMYMRAIRIHPKSMLNYWEINWDLVRLEYQDFFEIATDC